MSGDTIDSNSAFLALALSDLGIAINEKVTVGDNLEDLVSQIMRLGSDSTLLIINGGLGPTSDDLTAEALARASKQELAMHKDAEKHVLEWCASRGIKTNKANLKQALLPASSHIFTDCPGSAPAFHMMIDNCLVIATPGVPSELKEITHKQLLDFIPAKLMISPQHPWSKYHLLGIGESRLQQMISDELADIGSILDIGFRADFPILELKFKPARELSATDAQVIHWKNRLHHLVKNFIASAPSANFALHLVRRLKETGKTISCAESCTGGLIASEITRIPGASAVFPGGIVSYSNAIKHELLHVPNESLTSHGAVSGQTVMAMFYGIIDLMKSDYAIAVTGIAGPDGGTAEKPAGTVWIAWGTMNHPVTTRLNIPLERVQFQKLVTTITIDLCIRHINGDYQIPGYLSRWQL